MPTYPSGFYVYLLVDPTNGVPFYCGKGQRRRAWQHAEAVARGDLSGNARKVVKIQEILSRGHEIEIQVVGEYELEDDALEHEFELVDSLLGLTNVMPGGCGRTLKPEEIARRSEARKKRLLEAAKRIFVAAKAREIDRLAKATSSGRNGHLHQREIAAWLKKVKDELPTAERIIPKKGLSSDKATRASMMRVAPPTRPPKQELIDKKEAQYTDARRQALDEDRAVRPQVIVQPEVRTVRQAQIVANTLRQKRIGSR